MSILEAAKNLIEAVDGKSSRDPDWEIEAEIGELRKAVASEEKRIQDFRDQFTQSGGITANASYEIFN